MPNKNWTLDDAQQLADDNPYTFDKPSANVVSQLKPGDLVKLIFRFVSDDPTTSAAERMWVEITDINDHGFSGVLDNDPAEIVDLRYKDLVDFQAIHIIDTDLVDLEPSTTAKYEKRCFVTNSILYDGQMIGYLYREETADDDNDDSGWRFSTGTETNEEMDQADLISYVSLGAVLSRDDSIVNLLDRGAGVAFIKDDHDDFIELAGD